MLERKPQIVVLKGGKHKTNVQCSVQCWNQRIKREPLTWSWTLRLIRNFFAKISKDFALAGMLRWFTFQTARQQTFRYIVDKKTRQCISSCDISSGRMHIALHYVFTESFIFIPSCLRKPYFSFELEISVIITSSRH